MADNMNKLQEIKLPEKWKDGNFIVRVDLKEAVAILRGDYFSNGAFGYYCATSFSGKLMPCEDWYGAEGSKWRKATDEEKQWLLDKMHDNGLDWDAKKKQLVDWRRKPKSLWISVKDRLPQSGQLVMLALADGTYSTGFLINKKTLGH